jgi:hypothetical protein
MHPEGIGALSGQATQPRFAAPIFKARKMLQTYDDRDTDLDIEFLLDYQEYFSHRKVDRLADEIAAYTRSDTPDQRAAALDTLARKISPDAQSRVTAIAELQRRGVLKVPATRWTQAGAAGHGRPHTMGWTGCERGYVARVKRPGGSGAPRTRTAFYAVIANTEGGALAAVRQALRPGDHVEILDCRLPPHTAKALGVRSGIPSNVTKALCPEWRRSDTSNIDLAQRQRPDRRPNRIQTPKALQPAA